MNLNKVIIIGRVVREPDIKILTNGTSVAHLDVATSRVWKDKDEQKKEEAEFHKVVAFGRTAEIIGQYCTKGQLVAIEGRLKTNQWETKDNEKRQRTEIIVSMLQLGPKAQAQAQPQKEQDIKEIQIDPVKPGYMSNDLPPLEEEKEEDTKIEESDESKINVDDIPF